MTAVAFYALTETKTWENEHRLAEASARATAAQLREVTEDRDRLRDKMSRLLDAHITGATCCRKCGTPWDKGNTYFEAGKRRCRNCNRIKQQNFRARRREERLSLVAGQFLGEAVPLPGADDDEDDSESLSASSIANAASDNGRSSRA